MPNQMQQNTVKVLVNAGVVTTTSNSPAFALPLADSYAIFINVTALASTSIDFVLQTSPDGGTTWLNLPLRFAQFTATGQGYVRFQPTLGLGESATAGTVAATGGALAQNTPFIGSVNTSVLGASQAIPTMRLGLTVVGAGSNTYTAYCIMASRGNTLA